MAKLPHAGAISSARARISFTSLILLLPAVLLVLSPGCTTAPPNENLPTPTITLNATQLAISVMLTETRDAPTTTLTPTSTQTLTPTATVEVPITGSYRYPGAAGDRVALGDQALTVLGSSQPDQLGSLKTKDGHLLMDYEVLVENTSSTPQDYNPYLFHLVVGEDTEYQPITSTLFPRLQGGTLLPNEWVRGHIAFDLPPNALTSSKAPAGAKTPTSTRPPKNAKTPTTTPTAVVLQSLRLRYDPKSAGTESKTAIWIDLSQSAASKPAALPKGPATIAPQGGLPGSNQRVEAAGVALTVGQPSISQRIQYTRAAPGTLLLSLPVTIEDISRPRMPYNPEYFIIKDEQGYEYPSIAVPLESILQPGSLKQNQRISSTVVFQVSASARQLVVKYQPQVLSGNYQEIRISINMP